MTAKKGVFFRTYRSIKQNLPGFVIDKFKPLVPLGFILSILDIFGLFLLLPIIQVLVNPQEIEADPILNPINGLLGIQSPVLFALVLISVTLVFFIVKLIITTLVTKKIADISFGITSRLVIGQYEKYINAPMAYRATASSGDLLRSIIEIPFNFVTGILIPYPVLINEVIMTVLLSAGILIYSPSLFLSILIFIIPVFILYTRIQRKRLSRISGQREIRHAEMFSKGRIGLDGFIEIILLNKLRYFKDDFTGSVNSFSKAMSRLYLYNAVSPRVMEVFAVGSIFAVLTGAYIIGYDIRNVASFLITFAVAAYRIIPSVNKIFLSYNNIKSAEFVFDHFQNDQQPTPDLSDSKGSTVPVTFSSEIEFRNVFFAYDSSAPVLKNINLKIKKGEFVGLIGPSGSGKTTILRLLLRLSKPASGTISVDGIPLDQLNLRSWYEEISYVPQNVTIFPGKISENIAFGIPEENIDEQKLLSAVENSQLSGFIHSLPEGVNTKIGENGMTISGGQRQRLGIARALYHNGKILILDEITSSVDKATEELLIECVNELVRKGYTILMVSHNYNNLAGCHSIYRIGVGELVPDTFEPDNM